MPIFSKTQVPWSFRALELDVELEQSVLKLKQESSFSPLTLRVCLLRGMKTVEEIQHFLVPKLQDLTHPHCLKDMHPLVERLVQARNQSEKLWIYGDYDVDGTAGAALLAWVFRDFGFHFEVRQPDRFQDGYGLHPRFIEEAIEARVSLLLTVDCGITSFAAAQLARDRGLDLLVIDHHQVDPLRGLPPALAIVNPQRSDCESGLKQLCGCALAYYVAIALRIASRQEKWFDGKSVPNLKQHLDLVVLATAADFVPLTGDNHILVRHGMEVLRNTQKPGLRALLSSAGLDQKNFSTSHLSFSLGPRINASGRLKSASLALDLLTTENKQRAGELANELELLNQERGRIQNQIWDEVRIRIEAGLEKNLYPYGIVLGDETWHEGVIGIIASRVCETFHKPAVIISIRSGESPLAKGSVRSYAGKDVLSALRASQLALLSFGGHRHAAGLSLQADKIDIFNQYFNQALSVLPEDPQLSQLYLDGICSWDDLSIQTLSELEQLGPFGPGNPEPLFLLQAEIGSSRVLKDRHLKLRLVPSALNPKEQLDAIWFHAAERFHPLMEARSKQDKKLSQMQWAGALELNRFRGQVSASFRIRDVREKIL